MSKPLRVVYAGTPDFAVPALQALIDSPHQVVAVYTQPDRPAGRGRKLRASPVKQLAEQHGIPVEQPQSLRNEDAQRQLASYDADVMVVAAYGLILPQAVLDTPRHGCLNIHGSILPRWRGAAPIHRAILAGDDETGITIMQMDEGLDTGDMLAVDTRTGRLLTPAMIEDDLKGRWPCRTWLQQHAVRLERRIRLHVIGRTDGIGTPDWERMLTAAAFAAAIPEIMELKQKVFADIDAAAPAHTLLRLGHHIWRGR